MPDARPRAPRLIVLAALLVLATCDEPQQQDYTKRFPIGALPETVTLTVPMGAGADPFVGAAGPRFQALVAGFLDRGHGAMAVTQAGEGPTARAQLAAVRGRLIAAGVPASAILTEPAATAAPDTVTLRYQRYDVVLPICGDWRAPMAFNPDNTDYPAFGCAIQRNLGLMLADPADIVTMRAPAPSDAQNFDRVIKAYRAGTSPEAIEGPAQDSADQNVASGTTPGANAAPPAPTSTR
jgi:pilus assembly protein CpaD